MAKIESGWTKSFKKTMEFLDETMILPFYDNFSTFLFWEKQWKHGIDIWGVPYIVPPRQKKIKKGKKRLSE